MNSKKGLSQLYVDLAAGALVLFGLYLASTYSYLLFHTLVELFSIVISGGIFMLAWNSRSFHANNYLLVLGIAYLFVGGIDLLHTLAYEGMGVFIGYGSNLATQLWIVGRSIESLSLLVAPVFLRRKLFLGRTLAVYTLITALLLLLIFQGRFPAGYVDGVGLTPFKKISEYAIAFVLVAALWVLYQRGKLFDERIRRLIGASIALTIGSELAFTFYVSVYGFSNLVGHFLKLVSFYLIYKAIIVTGLVKPYDLLFRDLKKKGEGLQEARDELEHRVEERTAELKTANVQLNQEIVEREQAEVALRTSEARLKALAQQLVTAQEEERQRLSRELHDEAGQALTALKISLDLTAEETSAEHLQIRDRIVEAARLADRTMEHLRLLAHGLRPPALDAVGLNYTLEDLCRDFSARTGLSIDYCGSDYLSTLSEQATISIYRLLQEALTNVAKHAKADSVVVTLNSDGKTASFVVEDDGQGFDTHHTRADSMRSTGRGLLGMKERIELLGGQLEIVSQPGRGTRVEAHFPLNLTVGQ